MLSGESTFGPLISFDKILIFKCCMITDYSKLNLKLARSEIKFPIFNENDELIKKKLNNCLDQIGSAILCIGETLNEKEENKTFEVIKKQLSILPNQIQGKNLDIAYEPVWAIGSGQTPESKDINEIHKYIKDVVQSVSTNNHVPDVVYGVTLPP